MNENLRCELMITCALAVPLFLFGCDDRRHPERKEAKPLYLSGSLEVRNGQSAVAYDGKTYYLIVPRKSSVDDGDYRVFSTSDGDFLGGGRQVSEGRFHIDSDQIDLGKVRFRIMGGDAESTGVDFGPVRESIHIGICATTQPSRMDIAGMNLKVWGQAAFSNELHGWIVGCPATGPDRPTTRPGH